MIVNHDRLQYIDFQRTYGKNTRSKSNEQKYKHENTLGKVIGDVVRQPHLPNR